LLKGSESAGLVATRIMGYCPQCQGFDLQAYFMTGQTIKLKVKMVVTPFMSHVVLLTAVIYKLLWFK
jgi:hypothetical protein